MSPRRPRPLRRDPLRCRCLGLLVAVLVPLLAVPAYGGRLGAAQPGPPPAVADPTIFMFAGPVALRLPPAPARDTISVVLRESLAMANKYALNTWWDQSMSGTEPLASWAERYSKRQTLESEQVRRYSSIALQLATAIATGAYDGKVTGVPEAEAADRTIELIQVLAHTHVSVMRTGGWGNGWQSALWAAQAGTAAWLLSGKLLPNDELLVGRMLAHEADQVVTRDIHYLRDAEGDHVRAGNSGCEEASWDGLAAFTAVEMLPRHPNRERWAEAAYERFVAAFARPGDVDAATVVNGRRVRDWISGSNAEPSGWIVNHGKLNPDYTVDLRLPAAAIAALAGHGVPEAVTYNAATSYSALTTTHFSPPWYLRPGGTFYVANSPAFYYPRGADWGNRRPAVYGALDAQVAALGLDRGLRVSASTWAVRHLRDVRAMQGRFDTGQMYGDQSEDKYFGREEHAGSTLARAQLAWFVHVNGGYRVDRSGTAAKAPLD